MNNLINIIDQLDSFFERKKYPLLKHFQEGKPASEIAESFIDLKLPLRDDIIQIYKWKNGIKDLYNKNTGEIELFTCGIMFPLELAVSTYALEVKIEKTFKKDFFPLFTSGGGDYVLIFLDEKKTTYGQLFLYSPSILLSNKPISIYDSLTTLFQTILKIYEDGGYYFNEIDNMLEVNYEIEKKIAKKNNPMSAFWKDN